MAELFEYPPPVTEDDHQNIEEIHRHLIRLCEQLNDSMNQLQRQIEAGHGFATHQELESLQELVLKNRKAINDLRSS